MCELIYRTERNFIMKKILALVMVAILAIAVVACGAPAEKDVLTMGTNAAFPPYEFVDENNKASKIASYEKCGALFEEEIK